jgi:hypothetical protein
VVPADRRPSYEELAAENAELRAMVETLRAQVAELRARLGQSSQNSSRPPSSDSPFAKPAARSLRGRSGRSTHTALSRDEVAALMGSFTDYLALIRNAESGERAALYGHMGIKLTYHPATNSVTAEAKPKPSEIGSCPRGDSATTHTHLASACVLSWEPGDAPRGSTTAGS